MFNNKKLLKYMVTSLYTGTPPRHPSAPKIFNHMERCSPNRKQNCSYNKTPILFDSYSVIT